MPKPQNALSTEAWKMESGDADMRNRGNAEAEHRFQHGNVEAWKPGNAETRKCGRAEAVKRFQY